MAAWSGLGETFANTAAAQQRPAGHFVVVENLPRGMTCRAAGGEYAMDKAREEWAPYPQWRGERSYSPSKELQADSNRQWYHFDAEGKTLGHLCQAIALTLRGKYSPLYDPTRDVGAFVVVTNCEKVRVSGKKFHYKLYFRNLSYRPGGLKVERFKDLQKRFPERIIMRTVWGAMPKTPSSRRIFKERMKLFTGPNHNYYHKDPIEYPMHKVKDCTHTSNLPRRERMGQWFKNQVPKALERKAAEKEKEDRIRLSVFKSFLKKQVQKDGEAAAQRMELDDYAVHAETARMDKIYDDAKGLPTPKRETPMYLGLNLPKKRISGNRGW